MNTPRDADEGRARPSGWPAYLSSMLLVVMSLAFAATKALLGVPLVVFALATAWGLMERRPWATWCALLGAGVLASSWVIAAVTGRSDTAHVGIGAAGLMAVFILVSWFGVLIVCLLDGALSLGHYSFELRGRKRPPDETSPTDI